MTLIYQSGGTSAANCLVDVKYDQMRINNGHIMAGKS